MKCLVERRGNCACVAYCTEYSKRFSRVLLRHTFATLLWRYPPSSIRKQPRERKSRSYLDSSLPSALVRFTHFAEEAASCEEPNGFIA